MRTARGAVKVSHIVLNGSSCSDSTLLPSELGREPLEKLDLSWEDLATVCWRQIPREQPCPHFQWGRVK